MHNVWKSPKLSHPDGFVLVLHTWMVYWFNPPYDTVVEKSQKKSHTTLRAKRATFTFWVDNSSLKMPKKIHFGEFLKTRILPSNSVTRQFTFNRGKNGRKCQNINNQCDILSGFQTFWNYSYYSLSFLKLYIFHAFLALFHLIVLLGHMRAIR